MVAILMMSGKLTTLGLLKVKVFWNKHYDVIISIHDVSNKSLLRDLNYIVDLVMWPKFGNSSISVRELIMTSIDLFLDSDSFYHISLVNVQNDYCYKNLLILDVQQLNKIMKLITFIH